MRSRLPRLNGMSAEVARIGGQAALDTGALKPRRLTHSDQRNALTWWGAPLTTYTDSKQPKTRRRAYLYGKSPTQILLPNRSRRNVGRLGPHR
jgi:hypothetical protein